MGYSELKDGSDPVTMSVVQTLDLRKNLKSQIEIMVKHNKAGERTDTHKKDYAWCLSVFKTILSTSVENHFRSPLIGLA